jgi:hypothetical protein
MAPASGNPRVSPRRYSHVTTLSKAKTRVRILLEPPATISCALRLSGLSNATGIKRRFPTCANSVTAAK